MVSIKERYRRLTMQKKLTISFAVPLTLLCILITMCCAPVMSNAYREQIQYSVGQSGEQVRHYITHYIENMYYMGQLIVQSSEVNRVLSDPFLGQYKDMAEAYREFYKLNSIFIDMESTNLSYRIGMYIPDELIYSNNCYFFYPKSQLKKLDEYEKMMAAVQKGQLYYTIMQEHTRSDTLHTKPYITQITAMEVNGHTYIVKVGIGVEEVVNMLNTARITPNNFAKTTDAAKQQATADGHYYCIPSQLSTYRAYGPIYRTDIMEGTDWDGKMESFEDVEKYLDIVKETHPELEPIDIYSAGSEWDDTYMFSLGYLPSKGSTNDFFWFDPTQENPQLFTYYETEETPDFLTMMTRWNEKGFFTKSALSDTDSTKTQNGKAAMRTLRKDLQKMMSGRNIQLLQLILPILRQNMQPARMYISSTGGHWS